MLALVALIAQREVFGAEIVPSLFALAVGIVVTGIYLVGLLERGDRKILRLGLDSIAVVAVGVAGIWVMYAIGGGEQ